MADVMEKTPAAVAAPPAESHSPKTLARGHLNVLRRAVNGEPAGDDDVSKALDGLLLYFHHPSLADLGDDESSIVCDEFQLDEALARANRGDVAECVIHLGRALPQRFSRIADVLERALGERR